VYNQIMTNPTNLHELADALAVQAHSVRQEASNPRDGLSFRSYKIGYADALLDTRATVLAMIAEQTPVASEGWQTQALATLYPEHALVIYPPDEHSPHFHVTGDLREIRDLYNKSMNYLVCDALHEAQDGPEALPGDPDIDCEYSAFFAHCDSQEAAEALRDRAEALARTIESTPRNVDYSEHEWTF